MTDATPTGTARGTEDRKAAQREAMRDAGGLVALALAARALTWSAAMTLPTFRAPDVDAAVYDAGARAIAGGDLGFGHDVLRLSPGYFYFLGGLYRIFGQGPYGFRLVQASLGVGLTLLVWAASRRLHGPRWARLAGALAAIHGPLAFFETTQLSDTPGAFASALLTYGVVVLADTKAPRLREFAALGAALGLAADLRPNAVLWIAPALALALSRPVSTRRRAAFAGVMLAAAALAIAPITARNVVVAGEWVPLTAHGGINLYLGNGHGATGSFRVLPEVTDARGPAEGFAAYHASAERAVGHSLTAREADSYWVRRTLEDIADDPAAFARIVLRKLRLLVNGFEIWDVYHLDFYRHVVPRLALLPDYRLLAPWVLLGLWLALARSTHRAERWVAAFAIVGAASFTVALVTARYRFLVLPPAFLLATGAARAVHSALTRDDAAIWPRRALPLALLALSVLVTWPLTPRHSVFAEEYFKLGAGRHAEGDLIGAEEAYRESLARAPDHLRSANNLATLLESRGRVDEAEPLWASIATRAAATDPTLAARAERHRDAIRSARGEPRSPTPEPTVPRTDPPPTPALP